MSSNISSDSGLQREQSLSPSGNAQLSPTDGKVSESFTGIYPYQPLQSDGHIRLLLLKPPASSSTQDIPVISATLHEVNLSAVGETPCPPYKALSYEWGLPPSNPSDTPAILLDNHPIHIRQNLYDALCSILHNHHRLYGESPLYLWVDALCINQFDNREKGHQVRLMKESYETAEMVIVWLGMGTEHTDEAMKLINLEEEELCRCVAKQSLTSREQYGLRDLLCEATYWKRIWILQEFVLARDYVVLCNRALATKEVFERALKILIIFGSLRPLLWVLRPNGQRTLHDSPVLRIISSLGIRACIHRQRLMTG
ncbi:heterokaryon incompatibility protein-domain-containing protein [Neurospora tetraspora]|uniref:Heterokaryon incompatibility protein-domain-containing protein n=1 Tax=Neurospora tetraspora TaxID=94610 RepID=A0AAE0JGM7_9PEZI|nr:heterokaryon incompatibility protein-domain-containing protein [Neurospora tetraspora]